MGKILNIKKFFFIYLLMHLLLWSCIALLRQLLPIDAAESIYWGSLCDWGTNKHPPLAGWISYFVYNITGKLDFSIYFLGQIFIIIGLFYVYKIGTLFLEETKAILATMIMETCYVYSYCTIYDGFNPNFLLFCFLPMIVYYFYLAINKNKLSDWVILGVLAGLASLAKYQSIMLFIPIFLFIIFTKQGRQQIKKSGLYVSLFIAFLIFLPHFIWLFKNDFFSLGYFIESEIKYSDYFNNNVKYILSPALFLFRQFITILGIIFIYFSAKIIFKSPMKFNKELNSNSIFLIYTGILPLLIQTIPGFLNGAFMIPVWGFTLLFLTGVLIFYFFPMDISEKIIKYIISWIFASMIVISVILTLVYTTTRDLPLLFPTKKIHQDITKIYKEQTGKDLKYIAGFIEFSIPISLYDSKIITILDCWRHSNPWIKDIKKEDVLFIDRYKSFVINDVKAIFPETNPSDIKIYKREITVKSLIGKNKKYNINYAIIKKQ